MQTSKSLPVIAGPSWPGVRLFATTRHGGVSQPPFHSLNLGEHVGDDADAVLRNRAIVQQLLPGVPCWLRQVHGAHVHDADSGRDDTAPEADAAVTTQRGRVLAIMTADCLPVVMSDRAGSVLAVSHAGWRGLAAGVLESTVAAMRSRVRSGDDLQAWVGPAIGPTAFEVGQDVFDAFADQPRAFRPRQDAPGKWWCNLPMLAAQRLRQAGVVTIVQSDLCTVSDDRFFSYRRDGVTGRFATFAWLDDAG